MTKVNIKSEKLEPDTYEHYISNNTTGQAYTRSNINHGISKVNIMNIKEEKLNRDSPRQFNPLFDHTYAKCNIKVEKTSYISVRNSRLKRSNNPSVSTHPMCLRPRNKRVIYSTRDILKQNYCNSFPLKLPTKMKQENTINKRKSPTKSRMSIKKIKIDTSNNEFVPEAIILNDSYESNNLNKPKIVIKKEAEDILGPTYQASSQSRNYEQLPKSAVSGTSVISGANVSNVKIKQERADVNSSASHSLSKQPIQQHVNVKKEFNSEISKENERQTLIIPVLSKNSLVSNKKDSVSKSKENNILSVTIKHEKNDTKNSKRKSTDVNLVVKSKCQTQTQQFEFNDENKQNYESKISLHPMILRNRRSENYSTVKKNNVQRVFTSKNKNTYTDLSANLNIIDVNTTNNQHVLKDVKQIRDSSNEQVNKIEHNEIPFQHQEQRFLINLEILDDNCATCTNLNKFYNLKYRQMEREIAYKVIGEVKNFKLHPNKIDDRMKFLRDNVKIILNRNELLLGSTNKIEEILFYSLLTELKEIMKSNQYPFITKINNVVRILEKLVNIPVTKNLLLNYFDIINFENTKTYFECRISSMKRKKYSVKLNHFLDLHKALYKKWGLVLKGKFSDDFFTKFYHAMEKKFKC